MTNRDQIRRDAEAWKGDDSFHGSQGILARHCIALLTQLEQAERERDLYQRNWYGAEREVRDLRASLAKTPALVEALKEAIALADDWAEDWSYGGVKERTERIREALTAHEANQ